MRTALLAMAIVGGALSAGAQAQAPSMPPQPGYGAMRPDGNADRVVTREAYLTDAARRFARMDADHDGHLTQGERTAFREAMRDRQIADGAAPPPPPPPHDDRGGRGRGGWGQGAGRDVTQQDYMARAAERFDRMDTNHDGRLDASEMAALRGMRGHDPRGDGAPPPPPPGGE